MNFDLNKLLRPNIKNLVPYATARHEFKGEAKVFLDANENSFGSPTLKWYNRYPDPLQWKLKQKLATIKNIPAENMLLGNGSDECIDVLLRTFCVPSIDNVIICPPTYGMYEVSANINDIEIRKAPLLPDFQLNLAHIEQLTNEHTKIIWICSPNNPTGNSINRADIETILNNFNGIVVIDEAYINFSRNRSFLRELQDYPNLVILQTLSKAWGLAGLRLGMLFANAQIITILNNVKPPYNIGSHTQQIVLDALDQTEAINNMIMVTVDMREALEEVLLQMPIVENVYPSDANFLLVQMKNAHAIYNFLLTKGIVVRDRSKVQLIENCLRITIGTEQENTQLVDALGSYIANIYLQQKTN